MPAVSYCIIFSCHRFQLLRFYTVDFYIECCELSRDDAAWCCVQSSVHTFKINNVIEKWLKKINISWGHFYCSPLLLSIVFVQQLFLQKTGEDNVFTPCRVPLYTLQFAHFSATVADFSNSRRNIVKFPINIQYKIIFYLILCLRNPVFASTLKKSERHAHMDSLT